MRRLALSVTCLLLPLSACAHGDGKDRIKDPMEVVDRAPTPDPATIELQAKALAGLVAADAQGQEVLVRVTIEGKAKGAFDRPPVDLVLVVDASGSMEGAAIESARDAARTVIGGLEDGDRLSVIAFGSHAEVVVPSVVLSDKTRPDAVKAVAEIQARGTTDLQGGLSMAQQALAGGQDPNVLRRVILLSDGVPNDATSVLQQADAITSMGATITALGLGLEFDETLLTQLSQRSNGSYHFVEQPDQVASLLEEQVLSVDRTIAQNLQVRLRGGPGVRVQEVIGHAGAANGTPVAALGLGDLSDGETVDLFVRLAIGPHDEGAHVELLDVDLDFARTPTGAGNDRRTAFIGVDASADAAAVKSSLEPGAVLAAEQSIAASAIVRTVAMARAGDYAGARQTLLAAAERTEKAAADFQDAELSKQLAEMLALAKSWEAALQSAGTGGAIAVDPGAPQDPAFAPEPQPFPASSQDEGAAMRRSHADAVKRLEPTRRRRRR